MSAADPNQGGPSTRSRSNPPDEPATSQVGSDDFREADDVLLVPGSFPIHDLPDLGIDTHKITGPDYTTGAGLIIDRLGHIPTTIGETVSLPGLTAEVTQVSGRTVGQARLRLTGRNHRTSGSGETASA